jgi:serine-type D-Ala-D-Ala carboxypeptidase (penicillin-binding protein 5/6)
MRLAALLRPIASITALLFLASPGLAQSGFSTEATHAVIIDAQSGTVLFDKNASEPMPPASMSKLMTIYVTFKRIKDGRLKLTDTFTVSEDAWRRGGWASGSSNMCLKPKDVVSIEDLVRGVIILSGNDASIVLAEGISGSEAAFSMEMEAHARALGLETASFRNATGWPDPEHLISARDLALLARAIIIEFPDLYAIYSEREFDYCASSPANRFNRNPLLGSFVGADGLKTGYTQESGFGLVGSAVQNGERRIFVFNGMKSQAERAREAQRMMTAAFRDFAMARPFRDGDTVEAVPVFMGKRSSVDVQALQGIAFGYPRGDAGKLKSRLVLFEPLVAPIAAGQVVGEVRIMQGDEVIASTPAIAGQAVARLGAPARALEALIGLIRGTPPQEAPRGE